MVGTIFVYSGLGTGAHYAARAGTEQVQYMSFREKGDRKE